MKRLFMLTSFVINLIIIFITILALITEINSDNPTFRNFKIYAMREAPIGGTSIYLTENEFEIFERGLLIRKLEFKGKYKINNDSIFLHDILSKNDTTLVYSYPKGLERAFGKLWIRLKPAKKVKSINELLNGE